MDLEQFLARRAACRLVPGQFEHEKYNGGVVARIGAELRDLEQRIDQNGAVAAKASAPGKREASCAGLLRPASVGFFLLIVLGCCQ